MSKADVGVAFRALSAGHRPEQIAAGLYEKSAKAMMRRQKNGEAAAKRYCAAVVNYAQEHWKPLAQ